MENYLAQFGQWVTVTQGAIFVICVLAFRRGVIGEIGGGAAAGAVARLDVNRPAWASALGAVHPGSCRLARGRGTAGAAGAKPIHVGLGAEQPSQQPWDTQVHIELLPMQAVAGTKNLDRRKVGVRRGLQPLRQSRRERRSCSRCRDRPARARSLHRSARSSHAARPQGIVGHVVQLSGSSGQDRQPWIVLHMSSSTECLPPSFGYQAPEITSGNAVDPDHSDRATACRLNLCLAALPKDMDMRRCVVVGEHHKPVAKGTMHRDHLGYNPSKIGFQGWLAAAR